MITNRIRAGLIRLMVIGAIFGITVSIQAEAAPDPVVRAKADLDAIALQMKLYQALNGFFPTTKQGIQALVTRPTTDPKPHQWRELLDAVPTDPWGKPYIYLQPGIIHPESFDLYSAGPDQKPGTGDDISH